MVLRQRFAKLMLPFGDKAKQMLADFCKTIDFFIPLFMHLLICLFMAHHLYSCYRLRLPNKGMNSVCTAPPQIDSLVVERTARFSLVVCWRLKKRRCLCEWFSPGNNIRHEPRCQATNCFKERRKCCVASVKVLIQVANEKTARDANPPNRRHETELLFWLRRVSTVCRRNFLQYANAIQYLLAGNIAYSQRTRQVMWANTIDFRCVR